MVWHLSQLTGTNPEIWGGGDEVRKKKLLILKFCGFGSIRVIILLCITLGLGSRFNPLLSPFWFVNVLAGCSDHVLAIKQGLAIPTSDKIALFYSST